jgi:hypothetical protein
MASRLISSSTGLLRAFHHMQFLILFVVLCSSFRSSFFVLCSSFAASFDLATTWDRMAAIMHSLLRAEAQPLDSLELTSGMPGSPTICSP